MWYTHICHCHKQARMIVFESKGGEDLRLIQEMLTSSFTVYFLQPYLFHAHQIVVVWGELDIHFFTKSI